MDGKLFLTDEQRDWFLEMESTLGEEAVEIIGMMTVYILPQGDPASTSINKSGSENWLRSVKWWCHALTYQNVYRSGLG